MLSAIVDPSDVGRDLAERLGTRWSRSFSDLAASHRPEGVIIATPNQLHVATGSRRSRPAFPPSSRSRWPKISPGRHGVLVTMPHKVTTIGLVDDLLPTAAIVGACNAVRREADGRLTGKMFDGEGFVRGILRMGREIAGKRALVLGAGGVGSAIAASLARAGASALGLYDINAAAARALAARLTRCYPALGLSLGSNDPARFDIVVNATPLGMKPGAHPPLDIARLEPKTFVGEERSGRTCCSSRFRHWSSSAFPPPRPKT